MKNKKNIAFLIPSFINGGAERVVSNISQSLDKKYEQTLILTFGEKIDYDFNGKILNLKRPKLGTSIFANLISFIKKIFYLRKLKKDHKFDTVISLLDNLNILNSLSKKKEKTILSVHTIQSINLRNSKVNSIRALNYKIYDFFYPIIFKRADLIVCISKLSKKDLIKNYRVPSEKIKVIYNPFDIKSIQKKSNELLEYKYSYLFNDNTFNLIHIGRPAEAKGQWHLFRAFKKVTKTIKNIRLILLSRHGTSNLQHKLDTLTDELDLENFIENIGFQENPYKFLKKSDVFIMSSIYEGLPNVIIESFACQTPIISTDCISGPRELLAPDTNIDTIANSIEIAKYGILTPVCDGIFRNGDEPLTNEEDMLADAIISMYNNKELRNNYSKLLFQRAMDFDASKIIKKYEEIL